MSLNRTVLTFPVTIVEHVNINARQSFVVFLLGANIEAESPDINEISTAIPPKTPLEINPAMTSLCGCEKAMF